MLFLDTSWGLSEESDPDPLPGIPDSYDYYILELSKASNVQQDVLDTRIDGGDGIDIPDNCIYVKLQDEALSVAYEIFDIEPRGPGEPTLIITENHPEDYSKQDSSIKFDLGYTNRGEDVEPIIHLILRKLERDEFNSLKWEDKKLTLERQLPNLQSINIARGLAANIISLI